MKQKKPPIPEKMGMLSLGETGYTRQQWLNYVQERIRAFKKALRKKGNDQRVGMTDPMIKRRTEALLNTMPYIEKKYGALPGFQVSVSNALGKAWVHLNILASSTYNALASYVYILYAAALWILDQLADVQGGYWSIQKYLPKDEALLDELDSPELWDACYDYELIESVVYAIENRNTDIAPLEIDAEQHKSVLTSDLTAKNKHHEYVTSRKNFEGILAMIPQERIDAAVKLYQQLFAEWLDQYFDCLSVMEVKRRKAIEKSNAIAEGYNRCRDEVIAMINAHVEKPKKPVRPPVSPLVMNPPNSQLGQISPEDMLKSFMQQDHAPLSMGLGASDPVVRMASLLYPAERDDSRKSRMLELASQMDQAVDRIRDADEELDAIADRISAFTYNMSMDGTMDKEYCAKECGEDVAERLRDLRVSDPFALCFALLYLIDDPQRRSADSTEEEIDAFDLPWLYGAGTSFMQFVVRYLPWGIEEYEEEYDPVWSPDEEEAEQLSFVPVEGPSLSRKKPLLPDLYERCLLSDEEEQRNLAQLIYEETGCIMPRKMDKYADRVKELRRKGARSKDLPVLLAMMTLSGYARRQHRALNLDPDLWMQKMISDADDDGDDNAAADSETKTDWTKEELLEQVKTLKEQADQYQEQNKRLRSAVHDLEQKNRRAEKTLSDTKAAAEMERRELADLREVVFNQNNEVETEEEEDAQDAAFPYEVQQDTLIFGGHQTWLRTIRPLLKGNVRFIDKDLVFDVNIIRHSQRIWIQPNALAHSQFYRIMDTARTFHKPVRYFAFASAVKCAKQLVDSEKE